MSSDSNSRVQRSWVRLSDALTDVMSAPLSESDAKRLICNAIADLKIMIQLALRKHTTRHMTAHGMRFFGADVNIPVQLEPQDLDFENSRPRLSWFVRRERNPYIAGYWEIDWIELDRADVTKHLGMHPVERSDDVLHESQKASKHGIKLKNRNRRNVRNLAQTHGSAPPFL